MANVMEALVRFATETKFEDLPEDAVHESKRIRWMLLVVLLVG
jgi:hypothetical protein